MEEGHIHNKLELHRLLSKIKNMVWSLLLMVIYNLSFIIYHSFPIANIIDISYWEWMVNYEDQTHLLLISFRLLVLFIPESWSKEKLPHLNQMKATVGSRNYIPVLQWRHNGRDGVSNHQPRDCLLNRLFRSTSKKTSKLPVTGPLCGEFTGDRWIPRTNGQ